MTPATRAIISPAGKAAGASTSTSANTNSALAGAGSAAPADTSPAALRASALAHVARNAMPALRLWSAQGPDSPLRRDGTSRGQAFLEGFCVWAERVYGAPWLGAAMRPSMLRSARSWVFNARILPTSAESVMLDFERAALLGLKGGGRLYVWLPGALESLPHNVPAAQLVNRAPLALRTGERVAVRLFVPLDARVLHIEVRGVGAGAAAQSLRAEGWAAREARARAGASAIEVDVSKRSGWQRMVLGARSPLTLGAAWMER